MDEHGDRDGEPLRGGQRPEHQAVDHEHVAALIRDQVGYVAEVPQARPHGIGEDRYPVRRRRRRPGVLGSGQDPEPEPGRTR